MVFYKPSGFFVKGLIAAVRIINFVSWETGGTAELHVAGQIGLKCTIKAFYVVRTWEVLKI